jgi:hydrogenase maturation protease
MSTGTSNGTEVATARTLLLGMGNPILSDDAVGVRLAKDLKARLIGTPGLEFVPECSVSGYDRIIVLDSIRTAAGRPGDWYAFTAKRLRETMHLSNIHDTNFATAMELGRRLGHRIATEDDIFICAVEVEDNVTFSETMTSGLEAAYPTVREEILREVMALLES